MSSYRHLRRGRLLPVLGYVALTVFFLWAGATVILKSLIDSDYGPTMKSQSMPSAGHNMLQKTLTAVSASNTHYFTEALSHILVPRVVGTTSHTKVKEYIKNQLRSFGWSVTTDTFPDNTPNFGELIFENIIAKLNPSSKHYIVLACHYDSKYFPNMEFLGASDSAVPCAMLLSLAQSLQEELQPLKDAELSLELWFFDGEEAFVDWGPHDSLYGARHLAKKMEEENSLSKIKCLILLDLLGPSKPVMYNYYENELFKHFVASEKALRTGGHLRDSYSPDNMFFRNRKVGHYVDDDHTPFLHRKVPIIHWIPERFPEVWHTYRDNYDAIDMHTVEDMNKILRLFVLKYFNL
ncbi:glutaminyl-peptide cyclotransferase-like [Thrips palmi]|uniref:Glutaminyl-peptide cyclotransferase n=1 Tax=Thrips palmi TaxID=161013 RepID=A0A6P8ZUS5_THRPL|nr:glutaminyl-peptide cyclotransferase-like [Thrips palmi]